MSFFGPAKLLGLAGTNGNYTGDKFGTNVDRSAIQWFRMEISSNASALTVRDHGRVFDLTEVTNAWWYHYGSLAVNCPSDMVMGFSGSSATNYIGAFYAWKLADGTIFDLPRILRSGTIGHLEGWGDYSATVLDPIDLWSFWTVQAYSTPFVVNSVALRHWSTVIGKIRADP